MSKRKIEQALSISDLRLLAQRRLPKALFDFIDGGAEDEVAVQKNRSQFERWTLVGRFPVDVSERSMGVELFGVRQSAPLVISATGMAGLHHSLGEIHLASAAHRSGIPLMLSTVAAISIEEVAKATHGSLWFQLYILRNREATARLVERAQNAGYGALVVTVDCPVAGQRERDPRNGLKMPLKITPFNAFDTLRRIPWLYDMARHGAPRPENLVESASGRTTGQALAAYMQDQLDPGITWKDIEWVRSLWKGPMIVKGLAHPDDARAALDHGADGLIVSNHGGRQMDHARPTLESLGEISAAVGDRTTVLCDSGFRRGTDIFKALALGARAVCLGRATLFGLAAGGEAGVSRALTILMTELHRTMALAGCPNIGEITLDRIATV